MSAQLDTSLVRILDAASKASIGVGFLATEDTVLTCAHTVAEALKLPPDSPDTPAAEIYLDFPLLGSRQLFTTHVVSWLPQQSDGGGDIAVLRLVGPPPNGSSSAPLTTADNLWEHSIVTYGFPRGYDDGVWSSGRLLGRSASGWVQVEGIGTTGFPIGPGFSGAPVWDDQLGGVVGMIVAAGRDRDAKAAFMIPTSVLMIVIDSEAISAKTPGESNENKAVSRLIKQGKLESSAIEKAATTDKPISSVKEDTLGFSIYAYALRDFIASQDTTTPLTIGIDGPWGTGKTSLMRMVQNELDPPQNFLMWTWLKWFIQFALTLPVWLFGMMLLKAGDVLRSQSTSWFQELRTGLLYDPSIHLNEDISKWSKYAQFWARVASLHCPMLPMRYPTIWFNAWKFDQEEQLGAAFAFTVMDQIKQKYGPIGRIIFWFRLTFRRFSMMLAIWYILKQVALPLLLIIIVWLYGFYSKQSAGHPLGIPLPNGSLVSVLASLIQPVLVIGALISVFDVVAKIIKDPFQIPIKDIFDSPNYQEKLGFIGRLEDDFSSLVLLATRPVLGWKPQKLVVFIDDLDRCKPPKSADIIEAINLFLDSERCVFVIGLDTNAVVASIETKYKELIEKMRRESTSAVTPGRFFLDKIIQVPFHIPPPTKSKIKSLVDTIIRVDVVASPFTQPSLPSQPEIVGKSSSPVEENRSAPSQPLLPLSADRASYVHEDIRNAIRLGATLLEENPRQIKRFINLFRLHVYISNERGMFEQSIIGNEYIGLTPDLLAVWVAWSIRWIEVSQHLFEDAQLPSLRIYLAMIANLLQTGASWVALKEAAKLYPSEFKRLRSNTAEISGSQASLHAVYEELMKLIDQKREEEKDAPAHWCHLPWDWWLLETDFLEGLSLYIIYGSNH